MICFYMLNLKGLIDFNGGMLNLSGRSQESHIDKNNMIYKEIINMDN